MPSGPTRSAFRLCLSVTHSVIDALRATTSPESLAALVNDVTVELGFRHFALIHHDDLRMSPPDRVHIKD